MDSTRGGITAPLKLNINKVSNPDLKKSGNDSRGLPKMPRLYLELIENKDKVKQNLVNHEYDPDDTKSDISYFTGRNPPSSSQKKNSRGILPTSRISENQSEDGSEVSVSTRSAVSSTASSVRPPLKGMDSEDDDEDAALEEDKEEEEEEEEEDDDEEEEEEEEPPSTFLPTKTKQVIQKDDSDEEEEEEEEEEDDEEEEEEEEDEEEEGDDEEEEEEEEKEDQMEGRIHERKKPTFSSGAVAGGMTKSQKYAKILNENLPPKLSELEQTGEIHTRKTIPNLDRIYRTEDEEEELKREMLFKFDLLKKSYKNIEIPEYTIHSDLKQMSRSYESTLRRVSLDSCVDNYKQLLIGGFMVMEFILGYLFKFDMQGFTQQQIVNMNQYERLLIELGEKSYVPGGSQWPVEVRLLILVLGNATIFIIAKMIMKKTGSNVMGMMNSFQSQAASQASKRKMRGPSINPDDIPDLGAMDTESV